MQRYWAWLQKRWCNYEQLLLCYNKCNQLNYVYKLRHSAMNNFFKINLGSLVLILCTLISTAQVNQQKLERVEQMPYLPQPLQIIDYKKLAVQFDKTIYNFNAKGKFWPLIWIDSSKKNFPQKCIWALHSVGRCKTGNQQQRNVS